ncbi:MAG TPA: DUF2147 domain-containing protein [Bacteroidales bacterium]|nr:DUF2147 domain-containing protein [Bacteroidales bacterium]
MRKLLIVLILFKAITGLAQNKADDIIGYYYTVDPYTDEKSQCYIYKAKDGTYEAVVCWVDNIEKKYALNYVFMRELRFDAKNNEWVGGKITYPDTKGTYRAYMKFIKHNELRVRAYFGFSLFGKTLIWLKEDKKRIQK